MKVSILIASATTFIALSAVATATAQQQWATVKGQVVWAEEKIPAAKMIAIRGIPGLPAAVADDRLLIDAKSKGVKNVMVWLAPDKNGRPIPVNAALLGIGPPPPATITQAGGIYQPRIVMMRSTQQLILVNGLPAVDWFRMDGKAYINDPISVSLAAGARVNLDLKAEPKPMLLQSFKFDWMAGRVGVFDHPYFALTDKDGKFELKLAPVGNFRIFIQHELAGWLHKQTGERWSDGQDIPIKLGDNDLGKIPMKISE